MHEVGGHGSVGHNYAWKREEADKNILRTHTTAVSARMLHKLAEDGFKPCKLFSIDRVFRNEAVDRTHLAEFHQVEGVVCDKGLTLGDLTFRLRVNLDLGFGLRLINLKRLTPDKTGIYHSLSLRTLSFGMAFCLKMYFY